MKKILIPVLLIIVLVSCLMTSTFASTEYKWTDTEGVEWTIAITSETACTMTSGETTNNYTYIQNETKLTLMNADDEVEHIFIINEDGTLTENEDETMKEVINQVVGNVKTYIASYMQESYVAKIISWAIDAGVLGALIGIYWKYKRSGKLSYTDMKNILDTNLSEEFKSQAKEITDKVKDEILGLTEKVNKFCEDEQYRTDLLIKAFVLAQDKSAESKLALLGLLKGETKDEAVNEKIEEIKTEILETEEVKVEVAEKVQDDYKEIF